MTTLIHLTPVEMAILGELYHHEKYMRKVNAAPCAYGLPSTFFFTKVRRQARRLSWKRLITSVSLGRAAYYELTAEGTAQVEARELIRNWTKYDWAGIRKCVTDHNDLTAEHFG